MYSVKCGYRDSVARILTISEGGSQKLVNPVRCSEKVLNLEMRGGQSRDTEYRRGFVWNPGRRAKICGDYGISPSLCLCPARASLISLLRVVRLIFSCPRLSSFFLDPCALTLVRTLHPLGSIRAPRWPSRFTTLQVGLGGIYVSSSYYWH